MLEKKGQMTNSPNKCDVGGGHPVQFALIVGVYPASPTKGLIRASSSSSRARHVPVFGLIGYLSFSRRQAAPSRLPSAKQIPPGITCITRTNSNSRSLSVSSFLVGISPFLSTDTNNHQFGGRQHERENENEANSQKIARIQKTPTKFRPSETNNCPRANDLYQWACT